MQIEAWLEVLKIVAPIIIAAVTIIPSIISNRKKTDDSLQAMKSEIMGDISKTKREIMDDVNNTKCEIECVKNSFAAHCADYERARIEYEEHKARQTRYRILRFYDEVCDDVEHSESHWEDVLDDVDYYEKYCDEHKDFKNNRGRDAMEHLNATYKKLKAKNAFLTHKGD